jgi:hypothetical protein
MIEHCALLLSDCQGVQACRRQQHDMDTKKGRPGETALYIIRRINSGYSFTGSSACG